jgi:hypothetical protein
MGICRTCKKEFDPEGKKKAKIGYVWECISCSRKRGDERYLGRIGNTGKGEPLEIYRENLAFYRAALRRECGAGMNPNLGISTSIAPVGREILGDK